MAKRCGLRYALRAIPNRFPDLSNLAAGLIHVKVGSGVVGNNTYVLIGTAVAAIGISWALGISTVNMAHYLADGDEPPEDAKPAPTAATRGRHKPKAPDGAKATRALPTLRDLMAMARREATFGEDPYAALEALSLRGGDDGNLPPRDAP